MPFLVVSISQGRLYALGGPTASPAQQDWNRLDVITGLACPIARSAVPSWCLERAQLLPAMGLPRRCS